MTDLHQEKVSQLCDPVLTNKAAFIDGLISKLKVLRQYCQYQTLTLVQ